jgi:hypothetical protein
MYIYIYTNKTIKNNKPLDVDCKKPTKNIYANCIYKKREMGEGVKDFDIKIIIRIKNILNTLSILYHTNTYSKQNLGYN